MRSFSTYLKILWGLSLMVLTPSYVYAQGIPNPVHFTFTRVPANVKAGVPFDVHVKADIDSGWHIYSLHLAPGGPVPTSFSTDTTQAVIAGEVTENKPEHSYDPNFQIELGWHSKSAEYVIPLAFKKTINGSANLKLIVHYMVCNDRMCLPPTQKTLNATIMVSGVGNGNGNQGTGTAVTESVPGNAVNVADADLNQYLSGGVWSFLWIAITAGLAALLTPCVFPMIPLTVSFFSKQQEEKGASSVGNVLIFGLSIVGIFTLLGVILSLVLGSAGVLKFASDPYVNLIIGLIFVVFALSLLGLFELRLPYKLTNYLNRKSNESKGWIGILFMGLTISAVSFSCTAPFIGGVLAATAFGRWFYPVIGMIAFSTAFAVPFVLFAMFPKWLQSLPRSGQWMNTVKVMLGFIELAAAFKFLSNADLIWNWGIVTRPVTIAAWIVIFSLAGFYLLGKIRMKNEKPVESISTIRLLLAIPFLAFSLYLIPGLLGSSLGIWDAWLPPKKATDIGLIMSLNNQARNGTSTSTSQTQDPVWPSNYNQVLSQARKEGKPVFIDFTGYTCTNCRAMEANVFPQKQIQDRFKKFARVRLYTDDAATGTQNEQLQFKLTGTVALPTYAIVNSQTGRLIAKLSGYTEAKAFADFLDKGLAAAAVR